MATHKIDLRWLEGVTPKTTITWGTRTLNVISVLNPDGRLFEMVIMAGEYKTP